ncbi:MBL fold metallo-hydrolase [Thermopolyspora sp. NPDC052614]|uniref:MBL fold metallo-hydrolase n=1 Tax=Thermopolyspora sp. NPDC052614 TaxID=3155682 RepID=UPI0034291F7A
MTESTAWICRTCGNQAAATPQPPSNCRICDDERQYVGHQGQQWTTLAQLVIEGHHSEVRELEPGLIGIGVQPRFAIGQRALVVSTPAGQVLFDVPGHIDSAAVRAVRERGDLIGVAASHPHFYGVAVEWSHAFDGAPILIPEADAEWLMRPDPAVRLWSDTYEIAPGVTLVQCGGHFPGSAVLHWAAGADGRGALFTGDTITVVQDRRYVTFMRSYPNQIPLPERAIRHILDRLAPYPFDRIYGGWWDSVIPSGAREAVHRSAERYIRWATGGADPETYLGSDTTSA